MDMRLALGDALIVSDTVDVGAGNNNGKRMRRTAEQKRRIVEATFEPRASIARVAREHGVNAKQVFAWRGLYKQGLPVDRGVSDAKLLPVRMAATEVVNSSASAPTQRTAATINLEFPGKALVTIEGSPDRESLRLVHCRWCFLSERLRATSTEAVCAIPKGSLRCRPSSPAQRSLTSP